MKAKVTALSALGVLLLAVSSACGGGQATTTSIDLSMTDFQFNPNTFYVPAGREITVNASNSGAIQHDFVIMKFGTTVGDNYGEEDEPNVYWRVHLESGESRTTSFVAPDQPGEYQVVCAVPGHFLAGMTARLIVIAE
jgi:uncharacterized cupredoxin-like copper-binding protein